MCVLVEPSFRCRDILSARRIYNELDPQSNLVAWNAMISGHTRIDYLCSARHFFFDTMPMCFFFCFQIDGNWICSQQTTCTSHLSFSNGVW
ncbi:unnamed protein product [Brassica rapa]|uniref:Uncharacterized protein n=1 Tax=Brassica campestris TaxID=3711 RepID=A0A3P5YDC3_BRACM|nr:unnamed protein product [Brassica rapa]VDC65692.1 unnamed protein product [Brassica rapa]